MSQIWQRVQQLKGKTLHTLTQQKTFDISDVDDTHVVLIPQDGNRTERRVSREHIEKIVSLGRSGKEVTRALVGETYKDNQNTSYIAAIAHTIITDPELR